MKRIDYEQAAPLAIEALRTGKVLLSVGGDTPNTMTIGWGFIGYCWKKPILVVLVRPQRHTYDMIKDAHQFTVSMALTDAHKQIFGYAGSTSGAIDDKFEGHGITAIPAQQFDAPIVKECELHFECRTLLEQDMTADAMDAAVLQSCYAAGDYHRMFFGEIIDCYRTDI